MNGKNVKRSDAPKLLDVNLYSNLNFQKYIDVIERKAVRTAAALAIVGRTERTS